MGNLFESGAEIIPIIDRDEPYSFEEFVQLTLGEVEIAASEVEEPDGDVVPFLTMAAGGSFGQAVWRSLDPELTDKFLTHVIPPTVAGLAKQLEVEMVALVLTVFNTPMTDAAKAKHGMDRYEALTIAAISKRAEEIGVQAPIQRFSKQPPELGDFEVVSNKLPAGLARPLYAGLLGGLS